MQRCSKLEIVELELSGDENRPRPIRTFGWRVYHDSVVGASRCPSIRAGVQVAKGYASPCALDTSSVTKAA
jgi:hypothetical protein